MKLFAATPESERPQQAGTWYGFLGNVAATLGTRGVLLLLAFVSSIITSRYLGPEGRGIYAVLTVIAGIGVQLGNVGLHSANTFFLGQDRSLLAKIVSNSKWLSGVLGLLLVVVFASIQPLLWSPGVSTPVWLYYITIASIPFGLFYVLALNIQLGLGRLMSFNAMEIVVNATGFLAAVICLVIFQLGVESLIIYATLFNIAAASWLFQKLRDPGTTGFDFPLFSRMFRYSVKAYVAAIFAFLVIRFDLLMVGRMLGTEAAGIYSVAVQIADVLYLLPVSVGLVLFPQISAMKAGAWAFTKKTAGLTAIVLGICSFTVWLISAEFIEIAYGPKFGEASTALRWLLPGIWALGVNTVFMNYFAGSGMPAIAVISPGAAFGVNIGLNLLLIPILGISGASLASTVSYTVMLVCSILYLISHWKP